jgi:hypothetical protein
VGVRGDGYYSEIADKDLVKSVSTDPASFFVAFGNAPGYEDLARVLAAAYDQSARGKGAERHARGQAFENQPIRTIPLMLGAHEGLGGLAYQVIKKTQEAVGMSSRGMTEHAKKELLGAIVYAAAAYLHIEHYEEQGRTDAEG